MGKKKVNKSLKVAITVDNLLAWSGGGQVIKTLLESYPDAVIYTPISDPEIVEKHFPNVKVVNSFLQYFPFEKSLRRELYLLHPLAMRFFSFRKYDLVISVGTSFAKFISPWRGKAAHIHYCLTPPKFLWMKEARTIKDMDRISYKFYSFFMGTVLEKMWQRWDRKAAVSADSIISISNEVADRVKRFYKLESEVIYPPVETKVLKFNPDIDSRENWFLFLGRVDQYKGIDLAIKACINAHLPLKVAGDGPYLDELRELVKERNAKGIIKFLGFVEDNQKQDLLSKCRALIFPVRDEDFGIVPVEANASGAPVIAYKSGGVRETISEKNPRTGVFFEKYSVKALSKVLKEFEDVEIKADNCMKQASQFDSEIFKYKFTRAAENVLQDK